MDRHQNARNNVTMNLFNKIKSEQYGPKVYFQKRSKFKNEKFKINNNRWERLPSLPYLTDPKTADDDLQVSIMTPADESVPAILGALLQKGLRARKAHYEWVSREDPQEGQQSRPDDEGVLDHPAFGKLRAFAARRRSLVQWVSSGLPSGWQVPRRPSVPCDGCRRSHVNSEMVFITRYCPKGLSLT